MASDPISRFRSWFNAATRAEVPIPEAMALATADRRGRPSVRFVLLKRVDRTGFVFYTNSRSRKGAELAENPQASLAFYWDLTGKQVRVEGRVSVLGDADAERYWATRPRGSQIASAVSQQSQPIDSRAALLARYRGLEAELGSRAVARPPQWRGFRVVPQRIEFWTRREPRLHDREVFIRRGQVWLRRRLQP